MSKEAMDIVAIYRNGGIAISDNEAEEVYNHCIRKMDAAQVTDKEKYIEVLFPDELCSYLHRRMINSATALMMSGRNLVTT